MREKWLNGWGRMGSSVLLGSSVHCAGCGKFGGTTCVAIEADWKPPDKDPDWPFNEKKCPVCNAYKNEIVNITVEHLSQLSESVLRKALIKAKTRKLKKL